jgi:hypothetical protein
MSNPAYSDQANLLQNAEVDLFQHDPESQLGKDECSDEIDCLCNVPEV